MESPSWWYFLLPPLCVHSVHLRCQFCAPARKSASWTFLSDYIFSPIVHSLRFCPRRALPECQPAIGTAALGTAVSDADGVRFSRNHRLQFILTVPSPQRFEADEPLLPCALDGSVFSTLDLITLLFQFLQKIFVILGLFCKDAVDDATQPITIAFFGWIEGTFLPFPVGLYFNNRELMLQRNQVAQPLNGQCRKEKIPELF